VARKPTVSIVGTGRVGGAIAIALAGAGYTITAAWSRSRAGRQRAHRFLGVPILELDAVAAAGELVVVAVPDDAIARVAEEIAPKIGKRSWVVHTSGGTSIEALHPVRDVGAHVGSLHPLQTIPDPTHGAEALKGAAVAVTAAPEDRAYLMRVARSWGGRPFVLEDEAKALYHAAAVFASNYVVSSVWAATALFEAAGVPNAIRLLEPLVRASVDNVIGRGGARAITGPVARGDTATVRRHMRALREADPTGRRIVDAYRALARMTAALGAGDDDEFDKVTA
jgi:predicted short-subunit dehydrogenase-like oxidoreductase (DUF2520 family)